MLFFLLHGYRVIAHDRRGHGRSTQTSDGHDMDHYADDLAAVTEHLDLHDAVHVGHSTGGGEVAPIPAATARAALPKRCSSVRFRPSWCKTDANPGGLPKSGFDDLQAQLAANRSSSTEPCRRDRSMASTGPASKPRKRLSTTGGGRE